MLFDEAPSGSVVPQVRHFSSVPRAVFEALFCATPGEVTERRNINALRCQTVLTASVDVKRHFRRLPNRARDPLRFEAHHARRVPAPRSNGCPDNNKDGHEHAQEVARSLASKAGRIPASLMPAFPSPREGAHRGAARFDHNTP